MSRFPIGFGTRPKIFMPGERKILEFPVTASAVSGTTICDGECDSLICLSKDILSFGEPLLPDLRKPRLVFKRKP